MPYNYAPLSGKLFVTIKEYNAAFRLCELTTNPDPRPMLAIMARFMEANSRVGGMVRAAHDAVASFPWNILPSDPNNNQAVAIASAMKERFISSGVHHNFDVLLDGEFYGLTALKQAWNPNGLGGKATAEISIIPTTDLFRQKNVSGFFEIAMIQDDPGFKTIPIPKEELSQHVISQFNPFKSTRPGFVGGLLRSAIPLTIIKNFNWQDWSQFAELFGQPFRTAQYSEGTKDEDKEIARHALREFGKNAWALVSDNIKFELLEAARNGNVTAYESLMKAVDAELAILINGEANTQQLPNQGGSRAALQTMKLISDDRMWWRLKRVEEIVNEQHIAVDYRLNVSEMDISLRPKFAFNIEEQQDRESNARIVIDLRNAGYILDDAEVSAKTGFTVSGGTSAIPSPSGIGLG